MAKITFDGVAKTMTVNFGVTSIDVEKDLYSEWKVWVASGVGAQYEPAFRTFGGDSTVGTQSAPKYFFLTNGWRIIVDGQDVVFASNLYTDEGVSPVIALNGSAVSISNSDVPVVKTELQDKLDYYGVVIIDSTSIYSGVTHPVGTDAAPVNNITDALNIANQYNIKKFKIRGPLSINENLDGFTFIGDDYNASLSFSSISSCNFAKFFDLDLHGDMSGSHVRAKGCVLDGIVNLEGEFISCGIAGDIGVASYGTLTLDNCSSRIAGANAPAIDMNAGNDSQLNLRKYSGGIKLRNCDTPASMASLEFVSGKCTIESSCTDGYITVRGQTFVANNAAGSTVDEDALSSHLVWDHPLTEVGTPGSIGTYIKSKMLTVGKFLGLR